MCLIAFNTNQHEKYKLIMIANRDEFYARPTTSAEFWDDYPYILGGRDLESYGTWMGISKSGKIAALRSEERRVGKECSSVVGTVLCVDVLWLCVVYFFFKQKTAYEIET